MNKNIKYILIGGAVAFVAWYLFGPKEMTTGERHITSNGRSYNNPGNILSVYPDGTVNNVTFQGEIPSPDTSTLPKFKSFSSMAYGFRAIRVILNTHYDRGNKTLYQLIKKFSGLPDGSNLENYVAFVETWGGNINAYVDAGPLLANPEIMKGILTGMAIFEQGGSYVVNGSDVSDSLTLA